MSWREAVAPLRVDLEGVGDTPAAQPSFIGLDTGLLAQFACRGGLERLVRLVERAGDRLPEPRTLRTLEEQHIHLRRMHHDEDGERKLQA